MREEVGNMVEQMRRVRLRAIFRRRGRRRRILSRISGNNSPRYSNNSKPNPTKPPKSVTTSSQNFPPPSLN